MDSRKDFLSNQPVVIDNGSGIIKSGFAGKDVPQSVFPSWYWWMLTLYALTDCIFYFIFYFLFFWMYSVGRVKHTKVMAGGALEHDIVVGNKVQEHRGLMKIKYPIEVTPAKSLFVTVHLILLNFNSIVEINSFLIFGVKWILNYFPMTAWSRWWLGGYEKDLVSHLLQWIASWSQRCNSNHSPFYVWNW